MRTDDLVTMLATGAGAVQPNQAARRYAMPVIWGLLGAALLMAMLLGLRPDLASAVVLLPMFWGQASLCRLPCCSELVRGLAPVAPRRAAGPGATVALSAPVLAIWLLAAIALTRADTARRALLFFGDTWDICPFLITFLSVPAFVAAMWAMKGLGADALAPRRCSRGTPRRSHRRAGVLSALPGNGGAIYRLLVPARHADTEPPSAPAWSTPVALVVVRKRLESATPENWRLRKRSAFRVKLAPPNWRTPPCAGASLRCC